MKRKKLFLIVMIVFLISSNIFALPIDASSKKKTTISNSNSTKKKKKSTGKKKKEKKEYKYDDLQNLFLLITDDTTVDDIEKYISDKGLFYTSEEYKGSNEIKYKIAYTEKVAYQSHADEGSNIEITFSMDDNTILFFQYEMENKPSYTALYYNKGTWYDFSDNSLENYKGYYIVDAFGNNKGIEIEYSNGNKMKTNYFKQHSAEKTIQKVIDYK